MKTDLVVAGYIFNEDKVLLIHHKKLDMWLPLGGHIDPDETPDQAMQREAMEEAGLKVSFVQQNNLPKIGNVKENLALSFYNNLHSVGDHDHACFYYVLKAENPEDLKINKELKNFAWHTMEELEKEHIPMDVQAQAKAAFEVLNKK